MVKETTSPKDLAVPTRTRQLCVNLAAVMHTIAQPLTCLQLLFNKNFSEKMKMEELRSLAMDSAKEIERLCTLFGYMQGFILTENSEANLSEQDLGLMLRHVAEGLARFFNNAGLHLRIEMMEGKQLVLADKIRMYQALSRILLVVHELSTAKDTIELVGSWSPQEARIIIRNIDAYKALDKDATIRMALAEVSIQRQGGQLTWTAEPFSAKIELQVARHGTGMSFAEPPLFAGSNSR